LRKQFEREARLLAGHLSANLPSGEQVIRGGSYESRKQYATTTYRTGWPARGATSAGLKPFGKAALNAAGCGCLHQTFN
jgi:hypothetical protein